MSKSLDEINKTEQEYWNEGKLERSKIKKLRRHAFYYSYNREAKLISKLVKSFENKELLEIGSNSWA